jgi:outer membrane protein
MGLGRCDHGKSGSLVLKSIRRKVRTLLMASAIAVMSLPAAQAETLHEALAAAYRTNPTLGAERARQRATDEQVPQALSGWRPRISASGNAQASETRSIQNVFDGDPPQLRTDYETSEGSEGQLSIQLTQPIYDGGRTPAAIRAAESRVEAGRQQLLSVEQDILFRTVQAYMNVWRDRQIVSLRSQNIKVLAEQLRASRLRFQVGEVTRTDVAQSEARLSEARALESSARAQLVASIASYEALTGYKPGKLSTPRAPRLPKSLDAALRHAKELNPNILLSALVADAASHDIDVARSDLLPSLSVQGTAAISDDWEEQNGNVQTRQIRAILDVPLYDGGSTYSRVRQAKQTESQNRIQIIEATRQVRESVTSSWSFQISERDNISAARSQVAASQQALNGVREEYLVGSRSTLDVLNAQQELLDARTRLVQAERNYVVAAYQVLGNMGKLTSKYLALRVPQYQPELNYKRVRDKWFGTDIEPKKD